MHESARTRSFSKRGPCAKWSSESAASEMPSGVRCQRVAKVRESEDLADALRVEVAEVVEEAQLFGVVPQALDHARHRTPLCAPRPELTRGQWIGTPLPLQWIGRWSGMQMNNPSPSRRSRELNGGGGGRRPLLQGGSHVGGGGKWFVRRGGGTRQM